MGGWGLVYRDLACRHLRPLTGSKTETLRVTNSSRDSHPYVLIQVSVSINTLNMNQANDPPPPFSHHVICALSTATIFKHVVLEYIHSVTVRGAYDHGLGPWPYYLLTSCICFYKAPAGSPGPASSHHILCRAESRVILKLSVGCAFYRIYSRLNINACFFFSA